LFPSLTLKLPLEPSTLHIQWKCPRAFSTRLKRSECESESSSQSSAEFSSTFIHVYHDVALKHMEKFAPTHVRTYMQKEGTFTEISLSILTCYTVAYGKKILLTASSNMENIIIGFNYNKLLSSVIFFSPSLPRG
jgi:hypothetical protein